MRIIAVSDTHRNYHILRTIIQKHAREAEMFLFAGDGERELDDVMLEFDTATFYAVRGNCDYASDLPQTRIILTGDTRILLTHGDRYGVKAGTGVLYSAARENEVQIAVFGHTHVAHCEYCDGIYLFNPGSASSPRAGRPSYGIIDITQNSIVPFIVEL